MKKGKKVSVRIEPTLYQFLQDMSVVLGTDFSGALRWSIMTAKIQAEAMTKIIREGRKEIKKLSDNGLT